MADAHVEGLEEDEVNRRDFLYIATTVAAGVGAAMVAWPLIDQMNPAADVLALSSIDVDLTPIELGQTVKVMWRGKPVFIRHRTPEQIAIEAAVPMDDLPDPQTDNERVENPEWLVMIGVCTHLGCIPLSDQGDYGGWFCPCHGSHYDGSGRIRKGPAPENLLIPPYAFLNDNKIEIG